MVRKDQTDYAAAYRQYCTYSRGRSLKKFCEDENYNYTKLRRFVDKTFWTAGKTERDSIGCQCVPVEVEQPISISTPTDEETGGMRAIENENLHISITSVQVQLSNGLNLRVEAPAVDSLVDVLRRLVG